MHLNDLLREVLVKSRELGIAHIPFEDAYVLTGIAFTALAEVGGPALDLGAGVGFSTLWILDAARKLGESVIAVESDEVKFKELSEVASKAGFDAVKADVIEFLKGLRDESVGFAFVDVDNSAYPKVLDELMRVLKPGGVAVFHNALYPPLPQEFLNKLSVPYTVIPTTLGLLVAVKPREKP